MSLLSPIITAKINNRHQYKMKLLDINSKLKQDILSEFSKQAIRFLNENYFVKEFYDSLNMLYVYFEINEDLLENVITSKGNIKSFQLAMANFMKDLSKQIKCK